MLMTPETPWLTVRRISQHLGVREWSVARELKLGRTDASRLQGMKITGVGQVGQGGQWRVHLNDYLNWLEIPADDRETDGKDVLPPLHSFESIAQHYGITVDELLERVERAGLKYIQAGRNRYMTKSQFARFAAHRPAKTPASK